jgi:hypothetical protein
MISVIGLYQVAVGVGFLAFGFCAHVSSSGFKVPTRFLNSASASETFWSLRADWPALALRSERVCTEAAGAGAFSQIPQYTPEKDGLTMVDLTDSP